MKRKNQIIMKIFKNLKKSEIFGLSNLENEVTEEMALRFLTLLVKLQK